MRGGFFGVLQGFGGVLVGLLGELVGGEVIAFVVRCGGGLMGVRGLVVELGGSFVWALWHGGFSLERLDYRPIQPPSTVRMVPVT